VYYGVDSSTGKSAIWRLGLDGGTAPVQLLANGFNNSAPMLSPDGRWFAYVSDESGRPEVYVRPYPGPGGRWQVSLGGGTEPLWSPRGQEIYYRDGDKMMAVAVRTAGAFEIGNRTALFSDVFSTDPLGLANYDVTRDGQTFIMLQPVVGSAQAVIVTLNWFENLTRTR
jgi:serine/threonine-protein kinase